MYTTASVSFVVSPYSCTVASVVSSYDPDDALKPHCWAKSSMVFDVIGPIRGTPETTMLSGVAEAGW